MATDERFILVPYAGVNPSGNLINEIGIPTNNGTGKVACGIAYSNYTPLPTYFCRVSGYNNGIYFFPYDTTSSMQVYYYYNGSSSSSSSTGIIRVGSAEVRYTVGPTSYYNVDGDLTFFNTKEEAAIAFMNMLPDDYVNINYIGNGCLVNGYSYVPVGTGVTVPVTLPIGASLTADNISVTKNGTAIDFNYNPQTQMIAFTAI